jgi:hypothetical protein
LSTEKLEREEVEEYLDRLERRIALELDRRNLTETREFLLGLLEDINGEEGGGPLREMGLSQLGKSPSKENRSARGTLPGDRPGSKDQKGQPLPFQARAATHLKGLLGKGLSAGLTVRGEFKGRGSEVSQEEVVTSYRRQMEGELALEQIPEGLKETVKNYFLSLGMTENKK